MTARAAHPEPPEPPEPPKPPKPQQPLDPQQPQKSRTSHQPLQPQQPPGRPEPPAPSERPEAVCVMDPAVADSVLPADLRARLCELVRLAPPSTSGGRDPGAALGDAEILISGWGCPRLTADVLARAPRLRVVIHAAGTVKSLVSEAVWESGIVVSSAADANAGPVASYTVALIALAARRTLTMAAGYPGVWPATADRSGADGMTVGIVGASRIGRRVVAELAGSGAGYEILLYDPYITDDEARRLGARRAGLAELCRLSRVVSVHAPLLPETTGLLDAAMLALLPDGGALINTARGPVVDTEALTRECATGRIEAYLDVTDPEPLPPDHPLAALPNVLLTPHIAGAQGSEVRRLGQYAVEETERWVAGRPLLGEVTREALPRLA